MTIMTSNLENNKNTVWENKNIFSTKEFLKIIQDIVNKKTINAKNLEQNKDFIIELLNYSIEIFKSNPSQKLIKWIDKFLYYIQSIFDSIQSKNRTDTIFWKVKQKIAAILTAWTILMSWAGSKAIAQESKYIWPDTDTKKYEEITSTTQSLPEYIEIWWKQVKVTYEADSGNVGNDGNNRQPSEKLNIPIDPKDIVSTENFFKISKLDTTRTADFTKLTLDQQKMILKTFSYWLKGENLKVKLNEQDIQRLWKFLVMFYTILNDNKEYLKWNKTKFKIWLWTAGYKIKELIPNEIWTFFFDYWWQIEKWISQLLDTKSKDLDTKSKDLDTKSKDLDTQKKSIQENIDRIQKIIDTLNNIKN